MLSRNTIITAAATVALGLTGSAMAQSTGTYNYDYNRTNTSTYQPDMTNRTGSNDSLGVRNDTNKTDEQLRQATVWKGQRANNQILNVGNPLPEKTVLGRVGDIDNSDTGTLNHLPSGAVPADRTAVVASERIEPAPAPAPAPVVTDTRTTMVQQDTTTNGYDNRFLKPADPAVVTPDYKQNAGIDRTLAQDKNVYGRINHSNTMADDQTAMRDISNHPIDSLNDPRFKGPSVPESSLSSAQTASERITPDTYTTPAAQPAYTPSYTPAPVVPARPNEFQSTWHSESDALAKDDNVVRPNRYPDKDEPAPMKGERALNALDNTRNPVPDKTVFGKVGDIRSNGPVNNAGEPMGQP